MKQKHKNHSTKTEINSILDDNKDVIDDYNNPTILQTKIISKTHEMENPTQIDKTNTACDSILEHNLQYVEKTGKSYDIAQASVGLSHLNGKIQIPCQDSVKTVLEPRPILIACDGAGSSTMSDFGSSALCTQLARFCRSIEPILGTWLDTDTPIQNYELLVQMIYRQSIGILKDLSEQYRRDIKDFRSTLNFALIGTYHILWIKVGDGEIVQQTIQYTHNNPNELLYTLKCIGEHAKGEFANQTQFIDEYLKFDDVQWGILKRDEVHGLALMSDGASEKLVAHSRDKISGQINQWLEKLREQNLKASDIAKRFYSDDFNHRSTGDDRSIALWAEELLK